ncbi:MAG: MotA/TolQ/ExbB proton channel family protein [Pirellulaceae bacterium]|nr:MotA/TolQ/ExbB proton channel family protein [Pirellulaceae bacterium]
MKVSSDMAGKKRVCPYCRHALIVPDLDSQQEDEGSDFPQISVAVSRASGKKKPPSKAGPQPSAAQTAVTTPGSNSSDGSNVSLVMSGLIGFGGAVLLFGVLYPLKLADVRLGAMFWDSVGINFFTTWLMFWSFAILGFKWRQLARQRSAMMFDLLPTEISPEITPNSLDRFVTNIRSLPSSASTSILVNRVIRGIEHFRVRKSAAETVTMMESQSDIDASNVVGSYTIVKVFIWAMPILGFIGTVMGVSSAVAGLSGTLDNASDVSTVTDSMKGVFGGLGTAFDTTLLALVMSLIVKIPTSALQKTEDDLVTIVDEYCNENFLRRLNDGREGGAERGAGGGVDKKIFREAVEAAMGTHHAELENWLKKLDAIGSKLTSQVAAGWADINKKMHEQQKDQLSVFQEQYADQTTRLQGQLEEMNATAERIQAALGDLSEQAAAMQRDAAQSVAGSTRTLETHFAGIESGITQLNRLLESLGEQQVVVQQVEAPRRGWFGLRRNGK